MERKWRERDEKYRKKERERERDHELKLQYLYILLKPVYNRVIQNKVIKKYPYKNMYGLILPGLHDLNTFVSLYILFLKIIV